MYALSTLKNNHDDDPCMTSSIITIINTGTYLGYSAEEVTNHSALLEALLKITHQLVDTEKRLSQLERTRSFSRKPAELLRTYSISSRVGSMQLSKAAEQKIDDPKPLRRVASTSKMPKFSHEGSRGGKLKELFQRRKKPLAAVKGIFSRSKRSSTAIAKDESVHSEDKESL